MTPADLELILTKLPLKDVALRVGGRRRRLIAIVTSPDFVGQNEALRQRVVWQHLIDSMSDDDMTEIEFVFTYTPAELAELDRKHALAGV